MNKIFIDAGHGGNDSGARGHGLREKDLTLDISNRIKRYLNENYSDHSIKMSRTTDKTLSLTQRTNMSDTWGADYFLSIHINAGGGTGYEDYIYNGRLAANTVKYRDIIHTEVVKELKDVRNRGKKKANFAVLRQSEASAMLSENLFIDTKADADKLKSSTYLNKIAKGHAEGLAKALGLRKKKEVKPVTKNDHKPDPAHKKSWEKATKKGVFNGMNPQKPLTREQAATVFDRLGLLD